MITFLRKLFIKDYQNIKDPKVREKHGLLASIFGIVINSILFIFKLIIGFISGSMSIISDAINNLTDFLNSFVSLFGFKFASKPADKEHPFGHERIEYISGLIVCMVILCLASILGVTTILGLINQTSDFEFSIFIIIILIGSIILKIILFLFNYKMAKVIDSLTLKANALDSLNDVISTSLVLIFSIVQYYYPNLWYLDGIISLILVVYIFISGIKMLKETSAPLIGTPIDSKFTVQIINDIKSYNGILGVHDCIAHSYGPNKIFMTIHCEVDGYKNSFENHELIDKIENVISNKYQIFLTIHMDPIDTKSEKLIEIKQELSKIISNISHELSFHDVRIVKGKESSNVIFDLVYPYDKKIISKEELTNIIQKELNKIDPTLKVVIHFDEEYI